MMIESSNAPQSTASAPSPVHEKNDKPDGAEDVEERLVLKTTLDTAPLTISMVGDGPASSKSATPKEGNVKSESAETDKDSPVEKQQAVLGTSGDSSKQTPLDEESVNFTVEKAYQRFKDHDARLTALEKEKTKTKVEESQNKVEIFMFQTKPKVEYCNWEQFKNRFSPDEPPAAIEALVHGSTLDADIEAEQLRRVTKERREEITRLEVPRKKPSKKESQDGRIERVRINSAILLGFLSKVTGETQWCDKPHTFVKPFGVLIHFHQKMEEELRLLEKVREAPAHQKPELEEESESPEDANSPTKVDATKILDLNTAMGSRQAYDELQCYVNLIKERILPGYHAFDKVTADKPFKVRFDDLWSIFRPGEIVYEPGDTRSDVGKEGKSEGDTKEDNAATLSPHKQRKAPGVWRVYYLATSRTRWEVENLDNPGEDGELWRTVEPEGKVRVCVYYIDYKGKSYSPVSHSFDINYYAGEKDITSLPIYPLRFAADGHQTVQKYKDRGAKFRSVVSQRHIPQSYEGWTVTSSPLGYQLEDHLGMKLRPEHIDGDVVVDFHEAYQMHPWWMPVFQVYNTHDWETNTTMDEFAICHWESRDRSNLLGKTLEVIVDEDNINQLEWNEFVAKDKFMAQSVEDKEASPNDESGPELVDDDLCLLPARIFVYGLRERKFVNVDVRFLKAVSASEDPFKQLQISQKHKSLILSSVFDHLERKEVQRTAAKKDREITNQDFIPRKGRGLVVLLHGAPGVGKTATVEAVGYTYSKPLFPITCGDLGIDPRTVEENLSEIFRLANLWDCILLFDEAEIFLSRREKRDDNLQRNALVSIFLRTLEYYSGILFLTTNRVGSMDEAVKSRVHLSLFYPQLGKDETLTLFRMNVERLEFIEKERAEILYGDADKQMFIEKDSILEFAIEHYKACEEDPDSRWNGRQIRNAFQIASSLARHEYHLNKHRGFFLSKSHFKQVQEATMEFDEYRRDIFGKTDNDIAKEMLERAPVQVHKK